MTINYKGKHAPMNDSRKDIKVVKRYIEKNLLNIRIDSVFEKCGDSMEFFEQALCLLKKLKLDCFNNQKEFCNWLIQVNVLQSFLHDSITDVYGQPDTSSRAKIEKHFRLDAILQTVFQVHLCNYLKRSDRKPRAKYSIRKDFSIKKIDMDKFTGELPKDILYFEQRVLALEHNAFLTPKAQKPKANRFHYRCIAWFYALVLLELVRKAECDNEFKPAYFELPLHRVQVFANLSRNKDLITSMIMFVVWTGKKYRQLASK